MAKALISPPVGLPVTLAHLKAQLRLETDEEDEFLKELAAAATSCIESETGKSLITRIWRIYLDAWPDDGELGLPVAPVQSIQAITVYDTDGVPQVLAASQYLLDAASEPARLLLNSPVGSGRAMNGIEIDVVCGYGDTAVDIPDQLGRAVLALAGHWFEFRGAELPPPGLAALLAPYRQVRL